MGNSSFDIEKNSDRPTSFIDRDIRFENDIEHILGKLLKEFFRTTDDKAEIKHKIIDPINNSLINIFDKENGTRLELLEIIPPLEGKTAEINFRKGESEFHYNFLSAGEKEVFACCPRRRESRSVETIEAIARSRRHPKPGEDL